MFQRFKYRAIGEEIMDDFELDGPELIETLRVIEKVNRWLGGNKVLVSGIKKVSKLLKQGKKISVLDVGCGSGDGLRALSDWGEANNLKLNLIGMDANPNTLKFAKERTNERSTIDYVCADALNPNTRFENIDVVHCGLFLHHLSESQQALFLNKCINQGVQVVLINDLQRHWLAYYLFRLVNFIFQTPKMARHDGCLSILKGFKRKELELLIQNQNLKIHSLQWKWAFRYQAILLNKGR